MATEFAEPTSVTLSIPDAHIGDAPADTALAVPTPGELERGHDSDVTDLAGLPENLFSVESDFEGATFEKALAEIPETDDDIEKYAAGPPKEKFIAQRKLIRESKRKLADVKTLEPYRALGTLESVKAKVALADALLASVVIDPATQSPAIDQNGRVVRNFEPFLNEAVKQSGEEFVEGIANQAMQYRTRNEVGNSEPIISQVIRSWGLDPSRMNEYAQMDQTLAQASGATSPEDLSEIDPKYHEAYRALPAEVRRDFSTFEQPTQLQLLLQQKDVVDRRNWEEQQKARDQQERVRQIQAEQVRVAAATDQKLAEVRKEKVGACIKQLSEKVKFSSDPVTDAVMRSACVAIGVMALEPAWRFSVQEGLDALKIAFPKSFDESVDKFAALIFNEQVMRAGGDNLTADGIAHDRNNTANLLMAKVWPAILQAAKAMGGEAAKKGEERGTALDRAKNDAIPRIPQGGVAQSATDRVLPSGAAYEGAKTLERIAAGLGIT